MQDIRAEQMKAEQLNSPAVPPAPKKDMPITPERVQGLLSFVAQLAVLADGGNSSIWYKSVEYNTRKHKSVCRNQATH